MDGLLDDEDSPQKGGQGGLGLSALPKFAKSLKGIEILVPIEREEKVSGRFAFQQMSEIQQTREVPFRNTAQFHFEVAQAVSANGRLQILRQAVVHPLVRRNVSRRKWVAKPNRMADET